jgi:hypothetical protein
MSEEDEISLIVESDDSPSLEFWILWEERSKESSDFNTDFGVEVIEDKFGYMLSGQSMIFDIFLGLDTGDLEYTKHSFEVSK